MPVFATAVLTFAKIKLMGSQQLQLLELFSPCLVIQRKLYSVMRAAALWPILDLFDVVWFLLYCVFLVTPLSSALYTGTLGNPQGNPFLCLSLKCLVFVMGSADSSHSHAFIHSPNTAFYEFWSELERQSFIGLQKLY